MAVAKESIVVDLVHNDTYQPTITIPIPYHSRLGGVILSVIVFESVA